jgi:hypothetical protein
MALKMSMSTTRAPAKIFGCRGESIGAMPDQDGARIVSVSPKQSVSASQLSVTPGGRGTGSFGSRAHVDVATDHTPCCPA